jgi:DNA-binding NarL/FixJ family response regulator
LPRDNREIAAAWSRHPRGAAMGSTPSDKHHARQGSRKVLLVGRSSLVMCGIQKALENQFDVALTAAYSAELFSVVADARPDLLIAWRYQGGGGRVQDVLGIIAEGIHARKIACPFIVLMGSPGPADEMMAARAGAGALLSTQTDPDVVLETVVSVLEGKRPVVVSDIDQPRYQRSVRHVVADVPVSARDALMLLKRYDGLANAEIAGLLKLRPRTVEQYLDQFRRLVAGGDVVLFTRWIGTNQRRLEEISRKSTS